MADVPPASTRLAALARRHPIAVFLGLVFALTWPLQIIDALGSHGILPVRVSLLFQLLFVAYMPTVAALITTALINGKAGIRALLGKLLIWRVGLRWYAIGMFGFALICAGAIILANALTNGPTVPILGSDVAASSGVELLILVPVLFLVTTVVNGEELAWRGFALPHLQSRWNALTASVVLGLIWALFHVPLFFTLTGPSLSGMSMLSRSLQLIAASVIFTWLYNHTQGSVLLAYLLHGSVNTWTRVFSIENATPLVGWLMTGTVCMVAIILVVVFGAEHLRRTGRRIQHQAVRDT